MLLANRIAIGAALGAALIMATHDSAAGQATPNAQPSSTRGVRHILYLTVKSDDPGLQKAGGSAGQKDESAKDAPKTTPKTTLKVTVRLSDHAQETNFFGDVPITVADFDPVKGSPEQEVWRDERCHHERGFPKTRVIAIDGAIAHGSDKRAVDAKPRRIGLRIPSDEVLMASGFQFGADDRGSFMETHTRTSESRLSVELKMYVLACEVE
jgi:hypothetical protein